jgi:hypothetical protein
MARPRSTTQRTVKELVQQQRGELYATGNQNLNMALPEGVIAEIDALKKRYKLRSRDAVVSRIIRKCMSTISPDDFVQRPADGDTALRRISPIVANELVDYVQQVQRRFRNMPYGPVFEMIFAEIGSDLSNPAVQLELIRGGEV